MATYDQEIFKFFVQEDNFRNMCSVASHYDSVKKQLLIEFWKLVRSEMAERIEKEKLLWIIRITSEDISNDRTKIMLCKADYPFENNLPIVAIAIERLAVRNWPFFGLWVNNDTPKYDLEGMRHLAAMHNEKVKFVADGDDWWPIWQNIGVDFAQDEEFVRILPENRLLLAKSFADKTIELANNCEQVMSEMIVMKRN